MFVGEIDGPASESSFDTDVTVMKFLAVASRVAILNAYKNCCKLHENSKKQRPKKTLLAITRTIKSDSLKLLVTNDEKPRFLCCDLQRKSSENAIKGLSIKQKHRTEGTTKRAHVSLSIVATRFDFQTEKTSELKTTFQARFTVQYANINVNYSLHSPAACFKGAKLKHIRQVFSY